MGKIDTNRLFCIENGESKSYVTLHGLRFRIQNILSKAINLCTLVGSGASYPPIPLMGSTFDKFQKRIETTRKLDLQDLKKPLVKYVEHLKDRSNVEEFLSFLGNRIDSSIYAEDKKIDTELRNELLHDFIESINVDYNASTSYQTRNLYQRFVQGLGRSRQILAKQNNQSLFDAVNMFTTNYDLFHEYAIEDNRYQYTDGFTNTLTRIFALNEFHKRPTDLDDRFRDRLEPINPFFRLYKLHGSINWQKSENGEIQKVDKPLPPKNDVLIAPTSSKFALTQGQPYSDLFREFVNILGAPNTVLFTHGFSFNDEHIASLVMQALSRMDFMLYAFIERPGEASHMRQLMNGNISPNAFYIYPCSKEQVKQIKAEYPDSKDATTPTEKFFKFEDFVYCIQPESFIKQDSSNTSSGAEGA